MILKLRHNKVWTIIDGIQTVDYSDDFKSTKKNICFKEYTYACIDNPERFTTVLMNDGRVNTSCPTAQIDEVLITRDSKGTPIKIEEIENEYWYRAIYYLLKDGTRGSIVFDRICYLCNDQGTTIEKIPVKHNQEYYSVDKVANRIIAQHDENIVPQASSKPLRGNSTNCIGDNATLNTNNRY